jgi:uncharacterized membrane protein
MTCKIGPVESYRTNLTGQILQAKSYRQNPTGQILQAKSYRQNPTGKILQAKSYRQNLTGKILQAKSYRRNLIGLYKDRGFLRLAQLNSIPDRGSEIHKTFSFINRKSQLIIEYHTLKLNLVFT